MNSRTVERCNNMLRALYDERTELETDIELAGGNWLATLEDQLHEAEAENLEQMRQVI